MKTASAQRFILNELRDRDLNLQNPHTEELRSNAVCLASMCLTKVQISKYIDEAIDLHDLFYYNA